MCNSTSLCINNSTVYSEFSLDFTSRDDIIVFGIIQVGTRSAASVLLILIQRFSAYCRDGYIVWQLYTNDPVGKQTNLSG